jgi:hypothetical protein
MIAFEFWRDAMLVANNELVKHSRFDSGGGIQQRNRSDGLVCVQSNAGKSNFGKA